MLIEQVDKHPDWCQFNVDNTVTIDWRKKNPRKMWEISEFSQPVNVIFLCASTVSKWKIPVHFFPSFFLIWIKLPRKKKSNYTPCHSISSAIFNPPTEHSGTLVKSSALSLTFAHQKALFNSISKFGMIPIKSSPSVIKKD